MLSLELTTFCPEVAKIADDQTALFAMRQVVDYELQFFGAQCPIYEAGCLIHAGMQDFCTSHALLSSYIEDRRPRSEESLITAGPVGGIVTACNTAFEVSGHQYQLANGKFAVQKVLNLTFSKVLGQFRIFPWPATRPSVR